MIVISSVILIGLFNLILSIYSARDIKAKQNLKNDINQTPAEAEIQQPLREVQTENIICFDREVSAVIANKDREALFKITFSSINEHDTLGILEAKNSKVRLV